MKIVLVGAGGYGQVYLNTIYETLKIPDALCAVVDPYAEASSFYGRLAANGVPIYDTLADFYRKSSADLAIISSPIQFHEEQTLEALENGSHVLCEKPVAATLKQARNMRAAAERHSRKLAVGFQWSFSDRMRAFKNDVRDGKYGAPVCLKALLYWPREDAYYETGNWKGRLVTSDGAPVNDSVVTNATSHYLHNIFYVLGETADGSLIPESYSGSIFRLRDIESFDTCFLRGVFKSGARFYYCATHSCGGLDTTVFEYEFEKCNVFIDGNMNIFVRWRNGYIDSYADVPENGLEGKVSFMLDAIKNDAPPRCGIDAVMPHLTVTESIFEKFPVQNFPPETVYQTNGPTGTGVRGLRDAMIKCFEKELLPEEAEEFPFDGAITTDVDASSLL